MDRQLHEVKDGVCLVTLVFIHLHFIIIIIIVNYLLIIKKIIMWQTLFYSLGTQQWINKFLISLNLEFIGGFREWTA